MLLPVRGCVGLRQRTHGRQRRVVRSGRRWYDQPGCSCFLRDRGRRAATPRRPPLSLSRERLFCTRMPTTRRRRRRRWSATTRQAIEAKWQKVWADEGSFHVPNPPPDELERGERSKSYVVEMLPYPSGDLHMGHTLNYTIGDVITHLRRRKGMQVLRPMGYDAFGLPAENAAIKEGGHPRAVTERNIVTIREQMHRMGWAIDWGREISTHDPAYYRWTQWLFLRFYERGLAYRKEAPVKWCPNDQTVLANEQVIDGRCERCGAEVEAKNLTQWFFRITDYADELLDEMALLEDWPERVLTMQRNWIGRSHGARVVFSVEGSGEELPVFTTRPDTLFGATFFVLAPENPLRRAARRGQRARGGGARLRPPRRRALRGRARGEGEGRRLHRALRRQPRQRRADPDLGRRLRPDGLRHRRDHGRARARRARLRVRGALRARDPPGRRPARAASCPRHGAYSAHTADEVLVNSGAVQRAPEPRRRRSRSSPGWPSRASARRRSATACATGSSHGSATGAARSRSSTAPRAARCPFRTTSCPSCCPTSRRWRRRAARRSRPPRTGST